MTPDHLARVEALFHEAADLPPHERSALLDERCANHPALRAAVESLLRAESSIHSRSFLETPALARLPDSTTQLPSHLGHFRILSLLGQGGMGAVYEAEQDNPRRRVALKVIRSTFLSRELLARFQREAQALALLSHPSIAAIYEAGTLDSPHAPTPYFAMEIVQGLPIDAYAHQRHLTIPQRVSLLARVCDAVQHAHSRGVIHRDLKPANILVIHPSSPDADPLPKVLDFGVARLANPDLAATLQTDAGQLLGTLAYMSPEQLDADPSHVDARADVYALAVILYELLVGKPPIDVRGLSIPDAAHAVRNDEPTRAGLASHALRGDLETILHRALEKDPARRYPTPADLAADLRRSLRHQPIHARPPSRAYRAAKFIRRHRVGFFATSTVIAALLLATAALSLSLLRVRAARDLATTRAAQADAVTTFLQDMLSSVRPSRARGTEVTVAQVLDDASTRIDHELADQPLVEASIRLAIGVTYRTLSNFDDADRHLARALDLRRDHLSPAHPDTIDALAELAHLREEQARYDEAISLDNQVLDARRAAHSDRSEPYAAALLRLGNALQRAGRLDEAEAAQRAAYDIRAALEPQGGLNLAASSDSLARILNAKGNYADAEPLLRAAVDMRRRYLPPDHPELARSLSSLASLLHDRGRLADAEPLYREALDIDRRVYPKGDLSLAISLNNLASLLQDKNDYDAARTLFEESLSLRRALLPHEHPSVGSALNNLAVLAYFQGRFDDAITLFREALDIRRVALGEEHVETLRTRMSLAASLLKHSADDEAINELRDCREAFIRTLGPEHPQTLRCTHNLVDPLLRTRREPEALELAQQTFDARTRILGHDHPDTLITQQVYAYALACNNRPDEAIAAMQRALSTWQSRDGVTPAQLAAANQAALRVAQRAGRDDLVAQWSPTPATTQSP